MNINASLVEFLDKAGLAFKDPHLCLVFFEAAVSLEMEYQEFSRLKGTLARLYNKSAHSKSSTAHRTHEYTTKAETVFKQVFEVQENSVIDYTLFLLKRERISEAQNILDDFLVRHEDKEVGVRHTIDMTNLEYLVEALKTDVDTVSLALYLLVYCLSFNDNERSGHWFKAALQKLEDNIRNRDDDNIKCLINLAKYYEQQEHHV